MPDTNEVGGKGPISKLNATLTPEQRSASASRAGKASVVARREAKSLRDVLEDILSKPTTDKRMQEKLKSMGFNGDENIHIAKTAVALVSKMEHGDIKAVDAVVKLVYGDNARTEVSVNVKGSQVVYYLPQKDEDDEDGEV